MEPFYYNHMNKNQQAAYRAMQQGLTNLSDEFQIPRLEGKDLSNVFFELRLDHPEIFWASGFKYKYYPDSPLYEKRTENHQHKYPFESL